MPLFGTRKIRSRGTSAAPDDWTYESVDQLPDISSSSPLDCRGRRYLRTSSANAVLTYQALQREAKR